MSIPSLIYENLSEICNDLRRIKSPVDNIFDPITFSASIFYSQLAKIPDVIDFKVLDGDEGKEFVVFIDKPDWELEDKIYESYMTLLDVYPEAPSIRIFELFGKRPRDVLKKA
jgi:hypothetical protein